MGSMRRRSSGKTLKVVLIVAAVSALLLAALCCGLANFGIDLVAAQVQGALADNPVILEHIGTVESLDVDLVATGEAEGDETFVFDIAGPKGRGVLTAELRTVDGDREEVVSGTLRLPSGETYDLFPGTTPEREDE